jgi:hypothetical protein
MASLATRRTAAVGLLVLAVLTLDTITSAPIAAEIPKMSDFKGTWSGTFDQFSHDIAGTFPVTLTVETVSGDQFTGTMDWPTFDGTRTRAQGWFDGQLIIWTETEHLKGDNAELYGLYVAQFKADNEMAGDWMDPKHTIYPRGPRYGTPGGSITLKKQ